MYVYYVGLTTVMSSEQREKWNVVEAKGMGSHQGVHAKEFQECDVCSLEEEKSMDYWSHLMQWNTDGPLTGEMILLF